MTQPPNGSPDRRSFVRTAAAGVVAAAATGCHLADKLGDRIREFKAAREPLPPGPPTFSQYHLPGWDWTRVDRVLVLPLLNESAYTRADEEVRRALTSELQQLGRFEVIAAPPDDQGRLSQAVHRSGRFDEALLLEIGRSARADVVVAATITHYSPYPRPRLGLVVQAVAPLRAKVAASVDGLWDTADQRIADRVRAYYRQRPKERPNWVVRNHVIASDDGFTEQLALESPALFQRFVCHEAALALLGLPVPGVATEIDGGLAGTDCQQ
ncbi:MAG: hypothetical protein K2X82_14960 [Gemmataceae bacterium]|nr:hypothetical protein [Gemmataceae bacterium]